MIFGIIAFQITLSRIPTGSKPHSSVTDRVAGVVVGLVNADPLR
jgi:hypothetical protein